MRNVRDTAVAAMPLRIADPQPLLVSHQRWSKAAVCADDRSTWSRPPSTSRATTSRKCFCRTKSSPCRECAAEAHRALRHHVCVSTALQAHQPTLHALFVRRSDVSDKRRKTAANGVISSIACALRTATAQRPAHAVRAAVWPWRGPKSCRRLPPFGHSG